MAISERNLENELQESFVELGIPQNQQDSIKRYLGIIRARSEPTWKHSVRVGLKGKEVAKYTHIVEPKVLYYPGLLHDVGKSLTNPNSLDKTVGFGKKDVQELSRHPSDSYRILRGIHDFSAEVALRHHYFQGERSYPKKLPKSDLNLSHKTDALISYCARLISLIDFQDAASHRENDNFSPGNPRLPTDNEVKGILEKQNSDQKYLIGNLYDAEIFGGDK